MLSKFISLLFILLFFANPVFVKAQRNAPNVKPYDTTWEGEIFIEDNITIEEGTILTIKPGTNIKFSRKFNRNPVLLIEGELKACGTKDNMIIFTGLTGLPSGWEGIVFSDTSNGEVRYCKIINGNFGINCDKASPLISNNIFTGCVAGINIERESRPVIRENIFEKNLYGIKCDSGCTPLVIDNTFKSNTESGITYQSGALPTIISNNFIENKSGILAVRPQSSPLISFNNFNSNTYGILFMQDAGADIDNCVFTKNKFGVLCSMMAKTRLINCLFKENDNAIYGKIWCYFKVEFCDIIDNKIGIGLYLASNTEITRNNIFNNEIGVEAILTSPNIDWNNMDNKFNIKIHKVSIDSAKRRGDKIQIFAPKFNWFGENTAKEIKNGKINLSTFWDYYDSPLEFDRGTMVQMNKINYEELQKKKIEDCGIREYIKKSSEELNASIIEKNKWQCNTNVLKGKEVLNQ
ncbi:MAG: right-handed parallel beta-helix repeat-containing protein [Candidatus Firestonebacteria bacterium]|nr:right-handed parallel beta-helix repeat-containing protein [Candidatus Firestonebacteria bacterium]